jgi:hypothetical protein
VAPARTASSLLDQAAVFEANLRFDLALDRLYTLLLEQPARPDAAAARLRLARLLVLKGDVPAALLECQRVGSEAAVGRPLWAEARALATTLARRLRASTSSALPYFSTAEWLPTQGLAAIDTPLSLAFSRDGRLALLDEAASRLAANALVGAPGRMRVVKTDASNWIYALDEHGQTLRILGPDQRQLAVLGPIVGTLKLERVEDMAVDNARGIYLLERDARRITVLHLRSADDGSISAVVTGSITIPADTARGLKTPLAIAVDRDGSVVLAGKGDSRLLRLR